MPKRSQHCSQSRAALLEARARHMRFTMTPSEERLWQALRGQRLGVQFRRQVVIAEYIVDFCAPSVRLVVEVDGGYHANRARADARRDAALQRAGYRVLRVQAELVMRDLEHAVGCVSAAIAGL